MERSVGFRRVLWGIGGAAAMIATGVGVRAFAGPAGSALTYTGCLHKNGTIVDVALGDQPASPCDTKGTVHVGAGDITAVNTPVGGGLRGGGTSGDVSLSLAPIPAARVKASTPITVPDNTLTVLPLDFEELDTANLHNPADNTRISAPVAGISEPHERECQYRSAHQKQQCV